MICRADLFDSGDSGDSPPPSGRGERHGPSAGGVRAPVAAQRDSNENPVSACSTIVVEKTVVFPCFMLISQKKRKGIKERKKRRRVKRKGKKKRRV